MTVPSWPKLRVHTSGEVELAKNATVSSSGVEISVADLEENGVDTRDFLCNLHLDLWGNSFKFYK